MAGYLQLHWRISQPTVQTSTVRQFSSLPLRIEFPSLIFLNPEPILGSISKFLDVSTSLGYCLLSVYSCTLSRSNESIILLRNHSLA